MNIQCVVIVCFILLECAAAAGVDAIASKVKKVIDRGDFEWVKRNWKRWCNRRDFFDYVVTKSPRFINEFIKQIDDLREPTLAALFDKEPGKVDEVFRRKKYDDLDLLYLTGHRPELANPPEKFFNVLDRIFEPENREYAIQHAFHSGVKKNSQAVVEEYHGYLVVTSEVYAAGLGKSWNEGKPNQVFQFLLKQADKGDLEAVKREVAIYDDHEEFRIAIDQALMAAPPALTRHLKHGSEITKIASDVLVMEDAGAAMWKHEAGIIIGDYLLGEGGWKLAMQVFEPRAQKKEASRDIDGEQEHEKSR